MVNELKNNGTMPMSVGILYADGSFHEIGKIQPGETYRLPEIAVKYFHVLELTS